MNLCRGFDAALSTLFALPALGLVVSCQAPEAGVTDLADESTSEPDEQPSEQEDPDDPSAPQELVAGSCTYESPFSGGRECREYAGAEWTAADIESDCEGVSGEVALGRACTQSDTLGRCLLDANTERETRIVIYGTDAASCTASQTGCEVFGGGEWEPSELCRDAPSGGGGSPSGNVFRPPILVCSDPLPGEPPGQSEGGQVCTWQAVSGSTEQGRDFRDYASCDVIYSQRPYYSYPAADPPSEPDPRMDDPAYVADLNWVRSQMEASACICCHSTQAPDGYSNWYVEAPGNWMDTMFDTGLAMGAGFIDSSAFGVYPPEDNNGFDRSFGFPSTEPERMRDFFIAELAYRGLGAEDFSDNVPFGGPLYDQLYYEPTACENGEGISADGTIRWTGGDARYIYVLEADAQSPTVPPNLDRPEGTLWRLDVHWEDDPVSSGEVVYGTVPSGLIQQIPEQGAPPALVPGREYYLYVTADVIIPITRCLFTF